ncbi:MAG: hypothetical protein Q9162_006231 [Coniocarpon cinnabarinum]
MNGQENSQTELNRTDSKQSDVEAVSHTEKSAPPKNENAFVPPDGGLRAWLCVLGGFCVRMPYPDNPQRIGDADICLQCLFVSFGFLNACGIFQLYYEESLLSDYDSSTITWITTVALFFMFVLGPGFGILADKKGPKIVLIPASVLIVFAICMLSLSKKYYQILLSEGVAFGIGASALFLTPIVAVGRWFTTKRGLATGIVTSGSGLGGVIFPIFIPHMIDQHGFAAAVRWTALLMGCMLVIAVLTVSAPYGAQDQRKPPQSSSREFWREFKKPYWILYFAGAFLFWWGFFAPFDYVPLFAAVRVHASQDMSNNISSILNAFSVVGRILPGYLGDKFGQFNVIVIVAALSGISTLAFWLPVQYHPNEAATICFAGFFGFVSGGFISLMTPCIVQLCFGKIGDLGKRLGVFMTIVAFA